jgi:hypothetical protein
MMGSQCRAVPMVQSGLSALPAANIKIRMFGVVTDCCLYPHQFRLHGKQVADIAT